MKCPVLEISYLCKKKVLSMKYPVFIICPSKEMSNFKVCCLKNVLTTKCPNILKLPIQNLSPTRANSASHNEVENISSILINKNSKIYRF